jgi:hypothetical protein
MADSDAEIDPQAEMDEEIDAQAAPQVPIDPMVEFFPENWRTISEQEYEFWLVRANTFCPEGHHLIWIFDLSLHTLIDIQRFIRQSGASLQPAESHAFNCALRNLTHQLRIMQIDIIQGLVAANLYAESQA